MSVYSANINTVTTQPKKGVQVNEEFDENAHERYHMHYLYPEFFPPAKIPSIYPVPSHIIGDQIIRTLYADTKGEFMIYFCPVTCAWEPIRRGYFEGTVDTAFSVDSYFWYADQGTTTVRGAAAGSFPINTGTNMLNNVSAWNYGLQGVEQGQYAKKIRLLSAYLKLLYMGKQDDKQGLLKVTMGYKIFSSGIAYTTIDPQTFPQFPVHQVGNAFDPTIVRYKITDDEYQQYGPYTPYKSIPFFIIHGEGLTPGAPLYIEAVRKMEIVVTPEIQNLVQPRKTISPPVTDKVEKMKTFASDILDSMPDDQKRKQIGDILNQLANAFGRGQFNFTDLLQQRQLPVTPYAPPVKHEQISDQSTDDTVGETRGTDGSSGDSGGDDDFGNVFPSLNPFPKHPQGFPKDQISDESLEEPVSVFNKNFNNQKSSSTQDESPFIISKPKNDIDQFMDLLKSYQPEDKYQPLDNSLKNFPISELSSQMNFTPNRQISAFQKTVQQPFTLDLKESQVETKVTNLVNVIDKALLDDDTKEIVNEAEQSIKKIENLQKTLQQSYLPNFKIGSTVLKKAKQVQDFIKRHLKKFAASFMMFGAVIYAKRNMLNRMQKLYKQSVNVINSFINILTKSKTREIQNVSSLTQGIGQRETQKALSYYESMVNQLIDSTLNNGSQQLEKVISETVNIFNKFSKSDQSSSNALSLQNYQSFTQNHNRQPWWQLGTGLAGLTVAASAFVYSKFSSQSQMLEQFQQLKDQMIEYEKNIIAVRSELYQMRPYEKRYQRAILKIQQLQSNEQRQKKINKLTRDKQNKTIKQLAEQVQKLEDDLTKQIENQKFYDRNTKALITFLTALSSNDQQTLNKYQEYLKYKINFDFVNAVRALDGIDVGQIFENVFALEQRGVKREHMLKLLDEFGPSVFLLPVEDIIQKDFVKSKLQKLKQDILDQSFNIGPYITGILSVGVLATKQIIINKLNFYSKKSS